MCLCISYHSSSTEQLLLLFSCSVMSDSLRSNGLQHAKLPCPIPFSFCLQSFPAPGSFLVSQLFASDGQSIGASVSASVLPMNIQDRFPLELTGLISLQSKILKSLFQHHSSKVSILRCSAFVMVQVSHPYMTTGKTISTLITF